jgi:hypothetical protein
LPSKRKTTSGATRGSPDFPDPPKPPQADFYEQVQNVSSGNVDVLVADNQALIRPRRWDYVDYDIYHRPTLYNPLNEAMTFRYFYGGAYRKVYIPSRIGFLRLTFELGDALLRVLLIRPLIFWHRNHPSMVVRWSEVTTTWRLDGSIRAARSAGSRWESSNSHPTASHGP